MRAIAIAIAVMLAATATGWGQFTPYPAQTIKYQQPPPATPILTVGYNGARGSATICYWSVANYPAGASPINSQCVNNAGVLGDPDGSGVPGSVNQASVSWQIPQGATSVDIIRTNSNSFNGSCTSCLLLNNTVTVALTDNGSIVPGNFTLGSSLGASAVDTQIDNINWAPGRLKSSSPWTPESLGSGTPSASTVLLGNGAWGTAPSTPPAGAVGDVTCYTSTSVIGPCSTGAFFFVGGNLVTPTSYRFTSATGSGFMNVGGSAIDALIANVSRIRFSTNIIDLFPSAGAAIFRIDDGANDVLLGKASAAGSGVCGSGSAHAAELCTTGANPIHLLVNSLSKLQVNTTGLTMTGANAITNGSAALAALGTPADGTQVYCTDCAPASNPCTGTSTGTLAFRVAGAWVCF